MDSKSYVHLKLKYYLFFSYFLTGSSSSQATVVKDPKQEDNKGMHTELN